MSRKLEKLMRCHFYKKKKKKMQEAAGQDVMIIHQHEASGLLTFIFLLSRVVSRARGC
jgi:hypothetical protein